MPQNKRCQPARLGNTLAMRPVLIAVLVATFLAPALANAGAPTPAVSVSAACKLCKGAKTLSCLGCAGAGHDMVACSWCEGSGKEPCAVCGRIAEYVKKKYSCATCDGKRKSCKDCGGVVRHLKTAKGKLPCTNDVCYNGTVKTTAYTMRCAMCKGSNRSLDCPFCSDGSQKCAGCAGQKTVPRACNDCSGNGKMICPLCHDPRSSDCPWCKGATKVACEATPGRKDPPVACRECWGLGDEWCGDCTGLGRVACDGCLGTGTVTTLVVKKYTNEPVGPGGREKCKACNKRGTVTCGACTKGRNPCKACKQTGKREGHCYLCAAKGVLLCTGCQPRPYRSFKESAITLLDAGEFAHAVEYLDVAIEKAEKHFRTALAGDVGTAEAKALELERDETLQQLRYMHSMAQTEAELGDG